MKEQIIHILRQVTPNTVSGPEISAQIGISRVAVWKHIKQLKNQGYAIQSTPNGYRLDLSPSETAPPSNYSHVTSLDTPMRENPKSDTGKAGHPKTDQNECSDLPLPLYFPEREGLIHHFFSLSSTMDRAKEIAREGAPHLSVVISEEQTAGRGRLKREWISQKGGLWMTLILRPNLPPPMAWQVNFAASLSLAQTLRQRFDIDVGVKWPNDILFKEKKLAGLLSELETEGDMVSFVNIGIGLNVNNFPGQAEPNAVSIREILGRSVHRRALISDFLERFEETLNYYSIGPDLSKLSEISMSTGYEEGNIKSRMKRERRPDKKYDAFSAPDISALISEWKKMTLTIGRKVRIQTFGESIQGIALDVDDSGALIIRQDDGSQKTVIYGDCFHQPW